MGAEPPASPEHRPTPVFLVFDVTTADVLADEIDALWPPGIEAAAPARPTRRVGVDDGAPCTALFAVGERMAEWAARAQADPARWRALYVRPELMIAAEALGGLWEPDDDDDEGWRGVRAVDRDLKRFATLRMETIFAGGDPLKAALAELLERPAPDRPPPGAVESARYMGALAELLSPSRLGCRPEGAGPVPDAGLFPVRSDALGLAFLGRGWCGPESDFTWTSGSAASLLVPAAPDRERTCRLSGHLITHPDRAVRVAVRLDGAPVARLVNMGGAGAAFSIELTLGRQPAGGLHRIDLAIHDPVRPCDLGESGDRRELGVALAEIELADAPEAHESELAFLKDDLAVRLFARRSPRLTLVVAEDETFAASAARACAMLGCPQVLFTSDVSTSGAWSLSAAGARHVGRDLRRLGDALNDAGLQIDLAVLCDAASIAAWFAVCEEPRPSLEGASLILNTGSGYGCGRPFSWYVARWAALVQVSPCVAVAETWATP